MAKNANDKAAKLEADQAEAKAERTRKVLTDEERIAKLEAELKAAREKAEAKARKQIDEAKEKREKLIAKRDELNKQIAELTASIGDGAATDTASITEPNAA